MKTLVVILVLGLVALIASVQAVTYFEEDNDIPFVNGVLQEIANAYVDLSSQYQLDRLIMPGAPIFHFSSYDYEPFTGARYVFFWRDTITGVLTEVEGEMDSSFLLIPDSYGNFVVGLELFAPSVNRSKCEKAFPYRDSSFHSKQDIDEGVRDFILDSYGSISSVPNSNEQNPLNRGCDFLPVTHWLAKRGNGALMELGPVLKANKTTYDGAAYLENLGFITRWEIATNIPGALLGLPIFELEATRVKFYEFGSRYLEFVLFNPILFQTLTQEAQSSKRSGNIDLVTLSHNMEGVIRNPEAYKLHFPQYADGIDYLVANAPQ